MQTAAQNKSEQEGGDACKLPPRTRVSKKAATGIQRETESGVSATASKTSFVGLCTGGFLYPREKSMQTAAPCRTRVSKTAATGIRRDNESGTKRHSKTLVCALAGCFQSRDKSMQTAAQKESEEGSEQDGGDGDTKRDSTRWYWASPSAKPASLIGLAIVLAGGFLHSRDANCSQQRQKNHAHCCLEEEGEQ